MATKTNKTFVIAGISNLAGKIIPRFANDVSRVKVLEANGHTDITLVQLEKPMTKLEAVKFMIDKQPFLDMPEAQTAFAEFLDANQPQAEAEPKKRGRPAKAKVEVQPATTPAVETKAVDDTTPAATTELVGADADADSEDKPF